MSTRYAENQRLAYRGYSCSPSHMSSDMALSVMEKRLNDLEPIARSHSSGIEEGSTDRCPYEVQLANGSLYEWVNNWLEQQKFSRTERSRNFRSGSFNSSSATSPYRSAEGSTTGSERADNEELHHLRFISNQQKKRIHELMREKAILKEQAILLRQRSSESPTEVRDTVLSQNRFLNSEIIRLNRQCCEMQEENLRLSEELQSAREVIDRSRREYVFALQSAIRIPLYDNNALDVMHVKLLGGDMHKQRICQLMHEARSNQPSLPTLQSLLNGVYVDIFGFRHKYSDEGLAIHFMAMQLHEYYQCRLNSHFEHKRKWKQFLAANESIPITRETRSLIRRGIPSSLRATVWRFLIHQRVAEKKELYGRHYFRNLCSLQGGDRDSMFCASHQKQINLDLLRTMPNNVHFMSANCKGVSQLQQVLRAFCLHNTSLGYCQGMNFLASTALLFLGPEDAFWFLVSMTENFHDKSYFDDNLAGAQADQEVLKELLEDHFPAISAHLKSLDIDLATITLNWFLALFFDAVPFNTLLRIWDCFLLEGPKVLFRFALALLGQNQGEILARNDTIGVMKVVKAAVRLTYDVDGFFKLAFEELGELPSRSVLRSKQLGYLDQLNQKLSQRQHIRNVHSYSSSDLSNACGFAISDLLFSDYDSSLCYVIAGNQNHGHIGVISIENGKADMSLVDTEFDCRVCSFVLVRNDMAFAGLISGYIIALHLQESDCFVLWELKLPDAPLRLHCAEGRLFAALANGTLTVLENITEWSPTCLELLHIPLGPAPLVDVVSDEGEICIATACKLIRVDASTLTTVSTTYVACSSAGGSTPFFDRISCLASSPLGIFLCIANTTLVQLWSRGDCQLLYDVASDDVRRTSTSSTEGEADFFVSCLAFFDSMIWTGTTSGYVMMYSVEKNARENGPKFNLKRYPSGRRLSPEGGSGEVNRSQMCYIPTDEEARGEEIMSLAEGIRKPSRVSISIDSGTQQYSVLHKLLERMEENNSGCEESVKKSGQGSVRRHTLGLEGKNTPRRKFESRNSLAPSTLSCASTSSPKAHSAPGFGHNTNSTNSGISAFTAEYVENGISRRKPYTRVKGLMISSSLRSPVASSSNVSMEYDDLFEMYSDEDYNRNYTFNPRAIPSPTTKLGSESSCSVAHQLRRKDLEFDDPVVMAVPDLPKETLCHSAPAHESNDINLKEEYQRVNSSLGLKLVMKLKIADKPVKKMATTRIGEQDFLLTCTGSFSEKESLLLWRKEPVSVISVTSKRFNIHPYSKQFFFPF
ncbi:hypothetical protein Q1695_000001 [Nippostrongylus brasiliensis]|nr:hypothetical protein Q1695_000001 [Nippostrongylus brasiliensis]